MHELSVIADILKIALKHAESNRARKVVRIRVKIGLLTDFYEEWMQRYLDFSSKGTIAEGAVIEVEWVPAIFRCEACKKGFAVKNREVMDFVCPHCASEKVVFISGREFFVKEIEVS
ncbi:MAG: hydrogenase maturation nickel metallochaperone HypA [Georgfuchsia sp.]